MHVQGATLLYRDHTISHLQCYNTHDNDIRREVHDQHNITWLADQQPARRDRTHAETHVQQCYIHVSISLPYRDHTIRGEVYHRHNITWLADQQPACRDRTHAETHVQQYYIHVSISLPYRDHTIHHLQCYNIHT